MFKIPPVIAAPPVDSTLANVIPKSGEVVNLSRIYFEHDRTDFMPRAMLQLKQLYDFLKRYPDMRVEIIGHTDTVGSTEYNQKLSANRSLAVITWLIAKGIKKDRLISSGQGSNTPISTNATPLGRSMNRRVEVKIISL